MYATQLHHGIYPWNEPQRRLQDKDDSSGVYYGCDSKIQIAICLGCERTECVNCLEKKRAYNKKNYRYVPSTKRKEAKCRIMEKFKELYSRNLQAAEIMDTMQISYSTYRRYKKAVLADSGSVAFS